MTKYVTIILYSEANTFKFPLKKDEDGQLFLNNLFSKDLIVQKMMFEIINNSNKWSEKTKKRFREVFNHFNHSNRLSIIYNSNNYPMFNDHSFNKVFMTVNYCFKGPNRVLFNRIACYKLD